MTLYVVAAMGAQMIGGHKPTAIIQSKSSHTAEKLASEYGLLAPQVIDIMGYNEEIKERVLCCYLDGHVNLK